MKGVWLSWPRRPLDPARAEPVVPQAAWHRLAWTGARTRAIWAPRLAAIAEAALATELQLVVDGQIGATLLWAHYDALPGLVVRLDDAGLTWKSGEAVLPKIGRVEGERPDLLTQMIYALTVTRRTGPAVPDFGIPACCAERRVGDPLAVMLGEPGWADSALGSAAMLGALGLGPLRHLPCSPECAASQTQADAFLTAMAALGDRAEAGWLAEMTRWRIQASIVGGVAEVTSGAFRFVYRSDPVHADALTAGRETPEGAPTGLSAIFAEPTLPARTSSIERGVASDDIGTGFTAAGFTSAFAMRSRWSCAVWDHGPALRRAKTAIHLGCGSGLLLELLLQARPSLRVCGIDADAAPARARLAGSSALVAEADWLAEAGGWDSAPERYDLVFVDPEPIVDLADSDAVAAGVMQLGRQVVLLASDRARDRFGSLEAMAARLGFVLPAGRDCRVSALVEAWQPAAAMAQ